MPSFKSSRSKLNSDDSNDKKFKSFRVISNGTKSGHASSNTSMKNPSHSFVNNINSNKVNNSESSRAAMISNQGASAHSLVNTLNKLNIN